MDSRIYTPGAGHQPPVLAGRDDLMRDWRLMLNDTGARGRVAAVDTILVGPRGVGKTALLKAYGHEADRHGSIVLSVQAVQGGEGLIGSLMQQARTQTQAEAGPWRRARAAFENVAGVNVSVAGFGGGVSMREPATEAAHPDAGMLAAALAGLAAEVGKDHPGAGLLITVDELQVAPHRDLALLAATLHRLNVDHPEANVTFAATGLPLTPSVLTAAGVTHPDRLFSVQDIPLNLTPPDARYALVEPARDLEVTWQPDALDRVLAVTNGYPAHLQLLADRVWRAAPGPDTVTLADVEGALPRLAEELEMRTFGPRWDRMSDRQAEFLTALAVLGGRAAMAELATALGRASTDLSWLRDQLLKEGDIYVPRYGQVAMAVPLFAPFVLARYPQDRRTGQESGIRSLEELRHNSATGQDDPHPGKVTRPNPARLDPPGGPGPRTPPPPR